MKKFNLYFRSDGFACKKGTGIPCHDYILLEKTGIPFTVYNYTSLIVAKKYSRPLKNFLNKRIGSFGSSIRYYEVTST